MFGSPAHLASSCLALLVRAETLAQAREPIWLSQGSKQNLICSSSKASRWETNPHSSLCIVAQQDDSAKRKNQTRHKSTRPSEYERIFPFLSSQNKEANADLPFGLAKNGEIQRLLFPINYKTFYQGIAVNYRKYDSNSELNRGKHHADPVPDPVPVAAPTMLYCSLCRIRPDWLWSILLKFIFLQSCYMFFPSLIASVYVWCVSKTDWENTFTQSVPGQWQHRGSWVVARGGYLPKLLCRCFLLRN